jgi:hypothetical protein
VVPARSVLIELAAKVERVVEGMQFVGAQSIEPRHDDTGLPRSGGHAIAGTLNHHALPVDGLPAGAADDTKRRSK